MVAGVCSADGRHGTRGVHHKLVVQAQMIAGFRLGDGKNVEIKSESVEIFGQML